MRSYLNDANKKRFDRYFAAAVRGGCDGRQAEGIAKERTVTDIMRDTSLIHEMRTRIGSNVVRDEPAPRYRHGN